MVSVAGMKKIFLTLFSLWLLTLVSAQAAGGVVSAADPRASEAGREILRAGGSAADAQMAMMLALTVVEPQSSGIGGGGFFLHHSAKTGAIETIDGRETAPSATLPTRFMGADGKPLPFVQAFPGGISVGVPGNIALMAKVHAKWGKLPWAKLFDPAIRLSENGFQVTPALASRLNQLKKIWTDFPEAQAIYWQDGRPKVVGETVRNPAIAALFRLVAKDGAKAFYSGDNAKAIISAAAASARNKAVITARDIASYRAKDRPAVCTSYRVYKLCGMGPPSSGATTVFQILGMLERFDMKAMGKDDPKAWHAIAEAMMLAYADREKYLGDADFVSVPVAGLLDKGYIAKRSALISLDTSLPKYAAGDPPGSAKRTAAISGEVDGTTHFVAVDGAGNVSSMTSTIEGPFGSQLIANGYFLNIEIKPTVGTERHTGEVVAQHAARLWRGVTVPPLLTSFDIAALEGAMATQPELPRGLLIHALEDQTWAQWLGHATRLRCQAIVCNHELWSAETVAAAKAAGFRLLSYTVNDDQEAQRLLDLGTDGLITDRVDHFRPQS